MSRIRYIYRRIQGISDASVDLAMAAALPTAGRLATRLIALLLLQRRHPEGLLGLVLHFHLLPEETQRTVIEHAGELYRALREAADRRHGEGPVNAVQIIRRSLNTRLAYLVADQLRYGTPELQVQAGDCMAQLAQYATTDPRPGVMPAVEAVDAAYLQTSVEEALRTFSYHQQTTVLAAAMWLFPRAAPQTLALFADPLHPALPAMAEMMRQAEHPAARQAMLVLLQAPPLYDAGLEGLARCGQTGGLGAVLAHHHLLRLPGVAAAVGRLGDPDAVWPTQEQCQAMEPHESRGLAAWVMALPMGREEKVRRLATLRHLADPAARLFALRRLLQLAEAEPKKRPAKEPAEGAEEARRAAPQEVPGEVPGEASERGVQDVIALFCDDPDLGLARIALRYLARCRYEGLPRLLARLVNAAHPELRRSARQQLATIGFSRLWDAWPKLDEVRRLTAGRTLIKIDPNFHRFLAEKLRVQDRQIRLRAIGMIHTLHQGGFFEEALTQLTEGTDEVLASAAVTALGSAGTEAAARSVSRALEHTDSRVRANAVEAMAQLESARHVQKLLEMADEDENRPRANAIRALMEMRTSEAMPALTRMLADPRPSHRASALWLVETMGLLEVARQVAEMSVSDPDAPVRDRADRVIHELIDLMGPSSPSTPAASRET